MQRKMNGDLAYYTFGSLSDSEEIVHAISTRHGGVSPAPFHTLNLGYTAGDDRKNVDANVQRLHAALGLAPAETVTARQAQAGEVAVVGRENRGTVVMNVDALLTGEPGVALFLRYADCVPMLFYDPAHRAIAVAHAGWRGTVAKIATKTVQAMSEAFGTRPRDLIACIAPSIGPCCYRIGDDVANQVRSVFDESDALLLPQPDGSVHLDLWQANAQQIVALGVERVEIARLCTAHRTDDFYSWRAENANTGRFGAIIALKENGRVSNHGRP